MKYNLFIYQMRLLKSYKEREKELEEEIDNIFYDFTGVKGVAYDRPRYSYNNTLAMENLHKMMNKLEKPQKELDYTINSIQQLEPIVNENINRLSSEMQDIVKCLYWDNNTLEHTGELYGYSVSALWKKIKREIEKI